MSHWLHSYTHLDLPSVHDPLCLWLYIPFVLQNHQDHDQRSCSLDFRSPPHYHSGSWHSSCHALYSVSYLRLSHRSWGILYTRSQNCITTTKPSSILSSMTASSYCPVVLETPPSSVNWTCCHLVPCLHGGSFICLNLGIDHTPPHTGKTINSTLSSIGPVQLTSAPSSLEPSDISTKGSISEGKVLPHISGIEYYASVLSYLQSYI